MNQDDPFFGVSDEAADRTIIRPRPGGKGPTGTPAPARKRSTPAPQRLPTRMGANPLENAASSLLSLLGRLYNTPTHSDPASLRTRMIDEIRAFEAKTQNLGLDQETIFWARYVLCAALDEAVLRTPWGSNSIWQTESLLITFHKEASGGEKFFQLLNKLLQNPARNLDLLQLMHICLVFGFEGRYRLLSDGHAQLQQLRDELYLSLRNQRGDYERELSPHWTGIRLKQNPLIQYVPLWVVASVASVLLLLTYFGFSLSLNVKSDPVYAELHSIGQNVPQAVSRAARSQPPPAPQPRTAFDARPTGLRTLLAPQIHAQQLKVEEGEAKDSILIGGDGLFASGSITVKKNFRPLLERVARALNQTEGRVVVVGHTDNVPIRSLRFPSNWHLSQARAEAVATILAAHMARPERVTGEGRGSAEPLAANDTPSNRARNRRVEIMLLRGAGARRANYFSPPQH